MYYELKKCIKKPHIIFLAVFFIIWGFILPSFLTFEYWHIHLKIDYEKNIDIAQSYYHYGTSPMPIRRLIDSGKPRSLRKVREMVKENPSIIYKKQLEMLERVGEPQAEFTTFIQYYERFTNISMLVVTAFLLLIFGNIGSQEYTSKMNLILYSSPIDKRKIFANKRAIIIIVGSTTIFLLDICHFLIFFIAGYGENLNMKLNSMSLDFVYCPYNISVFHYFILKFIFQQITIIVMAAVIVFLSMRWKSSIITIAVAGIATIGGYSLALLELDRMVFVRYSLGVGVSPYFIFKDYYALGIGDVVLLYPILYVVWLLMVFFVCIRRCNHLVKETRTVWFGNLHLKKSMNK